MSVPGSNLLRTALRVIQPQTFDYYAYTSRTANAAGFLVTNYADPISLQGSVQPVARTMYLQAGLDFQKDYVTFFVSQNVIDVQRDVAGDKMIYGGRTYQCESLNGDWFRQDGWDAILCVKIKVPPSA